jgi:hypothetical protein
MASDHTLSFEDLRPKHCHSDGREQSREVSSRPPWSICQVTRDDERESKFKLHFTVELRWFLSPRTPVWPNSGRNHQMGSKPRIRNRTRNVAQPRHQVPSRSHNRRRRLVRKWRTNQKYGTKPEVWPNLVIEPMVSHPVNIFCRQRLVRKPIKETDFEVESAPTNPPTHRAFAPTSLTLCL